MITAETQTLSRDYCGKQIDVNVAKVYSLEYPESKPGAVITVTQKTSRRGLEDFLDLDSMDALRELHQAIGDFLQQEDQQKGGVEQ
jgi:hypothetical protein